VIAARRKLQQGRRRASVDLCALAATEPPGQIVDERSRRVPQCGQVDVPLGLAAGTFNFKPRITAIDGLVDRRGRVDRFAIRHIRSFQLSASNLSAWRISCSPSVRSSADRCASTVVIARALPSSLLSALRRPPESGVGWCFGAIRIHQVMQADGVPATTRTRASSRPLRDYRCVAGRYRRVAAVQPVSTRPPDRKAGRHRQFVSRPSARSAGKKRAARVAGSPTALSGGLAARWRRLGDRKVALAGLPPAHPAYPLSGRQRSPAFPSA
jgi:hypothetical protein